MADEKDAPEAGRRLHVTALLVASRRALDNALSELGFANDDDRVIEHDSRLAFLTCTHDEDCDDMFALISELSARAKAGNCSRASIPQPGAPCTCRWRATARSRRWTQRSRKMPSRTPPRPRPMTSRPARGWRR
jgi:hypothetical protein